VPILATKLYIPPPRPKLVFRPRLINRLNEGLHRKLTLISAPAGFGKTTLVSAWVIGCGRRVAWLSLDDGDNDPIHFLTYLVSALRTVIPTLGEGVMSALQSPQPPPIESILTVLLNEMMDIPEPVVLVLDDYHAVDSQPVDNALIFLLEHTPPHFHLVISTREDPHLPVARMRVRGQLTELRVADLRFIPAEAAGFLNSVMGLNLSESDITALETRTEGWIAGLQLAAISLSGHQDATGFIKSFTGNHRFVLDYLVEEVLQRQSEGVQTFLLRTSILDRLCVPLCDAVLASPDATGQDTLNYLERANLFIIPLDNERRWYRYHHLFADLLRQRLHQTNMSQSADDTVTVADLHTRASLWYEANGLDAEAFHHAVASHDIDHATRLVEGDGMPLPFRGVVMPVLHWLVSLPRPELDARPSLWVIYASTLLFASQLAGVETKLQAAEAALLGIEVDDKIRDLIGHIASIRATLAVAQRDPDAILYQSLRALEHLYPHNLPVRTATTWTLAYAYFLQGNLPAAKQAYREAISISERIGHHIIGMMATIGLGEVYEAENQLELAAETYQHAVQLAGDPPASAICTAHLGLARISHQQGDLEIAHQQAMRAFYLARQLETTDLAAICEAFIAQLERAREAGNSPHQSSMDALSARELEILRLIADGLSNHEISERLFLALSTVKGHNQKIFDKLQVQRRTEAIARARALGLL